MTYGRIIILIGIIIGILLFKKTKPSILKEILIGLILSFGISFFENSTLVYVSFLSFGVVSLVFTVYCGLKKKWLHLIIGVFAFVSFFFKAMHYPYANELKLAMVVPIVCYALTYRKLESYKKELSISTIFVAYELSEFLKLTELWLN